MEFINILQLIIYVVVAVALFLWVIFLLLSLGDPTSNTLLVTA